MKAHDLLLFWLAQRRSVSAARFAAACQWLAENEGLRICPGSDERARKWRWLRLVGETLQRLGHIEFLPKKQRWTVVQPVCLWRLCSDGTEEGEFYGARTSALRKQLTALFTIEFRVIPCEQGPERWLVQGSRDRVATILANLELPRIEVHDERGLILLRALPHLSEALFHDGKYTSTLQATGWEQCVFHTGKRTIHTWKALNAPPLSSAAGLYRERIGKKRRWLHLDRGCLAELTKPEDRYLAWWLERGRAKTYRLRYCNATQELFLPATGLPLPVLLDRALRLASGECPRRVGGGSRWIYTKIQEKRAEQVQRILEVPLDRE